jgi:hypothetical protein
MRIVAGHDRPRRLGVAQVERLVRQVGRTKSYDARHVDDQLLVPRSVTRFGVADILIAVTDGLKGMAEALAVVYAATMLQTCITAQRHRRLGPCGARLEDGYEPI